ncbi:alpha/beta hydrolase [Niveispirillum sp. KHB5.9]|uniref:alpha/beta hydrolase n=1 Tax=Niveispirillum sp. KHB5.9 TaxID=3400269 RepID=UPI003A8A9E86
MRLPWFLAVALLFAAPAAPAEDAPPAYQMERSTVHTLHAKMGRTFDLYVRVPPGYTDPKNAGKRYPVLYMTDGGYTFPTAAGISALGHSQKRLAEFIIVGIANATGEPPADARRRDLTPWASDSQPGSGGAPAYLDFLVTEAMPVIEKTYRIDPARRTLVGQSYGGLFGLWVLFTEAQHFSSYILTSPSIWFKDYALVKLEGDFAKSNKDLKARLYMTTGQFEAAKPGDARYNKNRDMVADQQEMAKRLRSRKYPGLRVMSDVSQGTYHETTFPVGLIQGLQWLYPVP